VPPTRPTRKTSYRFLTVAAQNSVLLSREWTGYVLSLLFLALPCLLRAQTPIFKFVVSGDSRNCGDVVMPAIADSTLKSGAAFYWHLGDFRAIYDFDEDMVPPASLQIKTPHLTIRSYFSQAWPDFIEHQLLPFGKLDVFLGIGNHETIFPMTHEAYLLQFAAYLNSPRLAAQRAQDQDGLPGPRSYFHWVMNNSIDFINLDNAAGNAFDKEQMAWVRTRLAADLKSDAITTIVAGMHEALPGSQTTSHSMCDSPEGIDTGREVYQALWNLQQAGKKVYVLASHSHFVMDDVYRSGYWKDHVLPGWIVGTAGAVRYRLPSAINKGTIAKTDVYGYLLANVMSDGSIQFEFKELSLDSLRAVNPGKDDSLLRWCFSENRDLRPPQTKSCTAAP
jgi:hypothetical protein